MLNILVCVKQVPDINLVKMDPVTGSLIRAGVPAILNPLDANALEAAVRVKEAHGGGITVITMGPDMAKEALRECLAAGADRAVLLSDRAFANADTLATSYVIVSAAKMLGDFDLIFCGKESLDGATGQMGSQLAERFGASQISSTAKIVEVDTDARTITAERDLERGVEVLKAQYPCLLTVEKANFRARIPNLKSWKSASGTIGHVAVVEAINGDTVTTSESGWNYKYFWTTKRSASSSNFSSSEGYTFQGFIYIFGNGTSGGQTPSISVKERIAHKYNITVPANYLLKNYTSELDMNANSKNNVEKQSSSYTIRSTERVILSNGTGTCSRSRSSALSCS